MLVPATVKELILVFGCKTIDNVKGKKEVETMSCLVHRLSMNCIPEKVQFVVCFSALTIVFSITETGLDLSGWFWPGFQSLRTLATVDYTSRDVFYCWQTKTKIECGERSSDYVALNVII